MLETNEERAVHLIKAYGEAHPDSGRSKEARAFLERRWQRDWGGVILRSSHL